MIIRFEFDSGFEDSYGVEIEDDVKSKTGVGYKNLKPVLFGANVLTFTKLHSLAPEGRVISMNEKSSVDTLLSCL